MKNTLKLSVLVLAFFASINMLANDNTATDPRKISKDKNSTSIFAERNDKVYLLLDNPELSAVKIEVRDGLDRLVYSEILEDKQAVKKTFNFTKAYAGSYHITVNNGTDVFYTAIEI